MSRIVLSDHANAFLQQLPPALQQRIRTRLDRLQHDPVPADAKFLGRHEGERVFRYRIGPYRAIYKLKHDIVYVSHIDKRSRVYDR